MDITSLTNLEQLVDPNRQAQSQEGRDLALKKAVTEFESLFIYQMLKAMRESIPKSGLLGNSREEEIYKSMLDQEMAKNLTGKGGVGLSELLLKQLSSKHSEQLLQNNE